MFTTTLLLRDSGNTRPLGEVRVVEDLRGLWKHNWGSKKPSFEIYISRTPYPLYIKFIRPLLVITRVSIMIYIRGVIKEVSQGEPKLKRPDRSSVG